MRNKGLLIWNVVLTILLVSIVASACTVSLPGSTPVSMPDTSAIEANILELTRIVNNHTETLTTHEEVMKEYSDGINGNAESLTANRGLISNNLATINSYTEIINTLWETDTALDLRIQLNEAWIGHLKTAQGW